MSHRFRPCRSSILAAALGLVALTISAAPPDWWAASTPSSRADVIRLDPPAANQPGGLTRDDIFHRTGTRTNYVNGYIEARAVATADPRRCINSVHCYSVAEKAARYLALEKLAETVDGIRIDSHGLVGNELLVNSELRTHVVALIQGAREVKVERSVAPDGAVQVAVVMAIGLQQQSTGDRHCLACLFEDWCRDPSGRLVPCTNIVPAPLPPGPQPSPIVPPVVIPLGVECRTLINQWKRQQPPQTRERYSGIILDARDLGGNPCVRQRILSESGAVVYGSDMVKPKPLSREQGPIGVARSLDEARRDDRVGANPLIVPVICVTGMTENCDFVISNEYAALIDDTVKPATLRRKAPVVAVFD